VLFAKSVRAKPRLKYNRILAEHVTSTGQAKHKFKSQGAAQHFITSHNWTQLVAYQCTVCQGWHIGHDR
jgi:hypothetical protein